MKPLMVIPFLVVLCSSCVSGVDEGCVSDEQCRNGRVCEDRQCVRTTLPPEPPTPIACTVESFEPSICRATFACEGGEERSFRCSIAEGRETDCKCERPNAQINVQADGCPADDITTFVNEVCNWDIQAAEQLSD